MKRAIWIGAVVLAVALAALLFVDLSPTTVTKLRRVPVINALVDPREPARCPLTGRKPPRKSILRRPAVGLKIENLPSAYPDSGLEKADIVFEQPVEGAVTRFLAVYHCSDAKKAGPVRSSRPMDPILVRPITRILGAAGGSAFDLQALRKGRVITISGGAPRPHVIPAGGTMRRIPRPGQSYEHTLYANTAALRKLGRKHYKKPPPNDLFEFGKLDANFRKVRRVTLTFQRVNVIHYRWKRGRWMRFQGSEPFLSDTGGQIGADNVVVLRYRVDFTTKNVDVAGNATPIIKKPFGSGKAFLFRDGRVIVGRWHRKSLSEPMRLKTKSGKAMVLRPGRTWIEVLPTKNGQVKGSLGFK